MKNFFYSFLLLSVCILTSCSQNELEGSTNGKSKLMVNLASDFTFNSSTAGRGCLSRTIDESKFKDINNYTLTLMRTSDESVVKTGLYSTWDLITPVDANVEYTLTASYGEAVPYSFDNLLVSGSSTFIIPTEGDTKNLNIQCKPKAAKVNVSFSEDFFTYYSDCYVNIHSAHMSGGSDAVLNKANDCNGENVINKDLYLQVDSQGEKITLTFDVRKLDGTSAEIEGFTNTKELIVNTQTLLNINIQPNVAEVVGGNIGITVNVNTDVTDENIDIVIPNTVFNKQ